MITPAVPHPAKPSVVAADANVSKRPIPPSPRQEPSSAHFDVRQNRPLKGRKTVDLPSRCEVVRRLGLRCRHIALRGGSEE